MGIWSNCGRQPEPGAYWVSYSEKRMGRTGGLLVSTLYTIINEPQVDNDMFNLRTAAESPSVPSRIALQGRY